MAERRHDDVRRRGDMRKRSLAARLRREARGSRPDFSPALHGRVVAAVAAAAVHRAAKDPPVTVIVPPQRYGRKAGVLIGAACVAVAVLVAGVRPRPASSSASPEGGVDVAALEGGPGIERLPTPAEIGEGVLAEVTTFAVAAVGVPAWNDLATFDPVSFVPGDDAGR